MTRYDALVLLHIMAAVIWLGAGFLIALLVLNAERARDRMREAGYHRDMAWLAPRLFIPSSLAVLVAGILLVLDGHWKFDQLWIVLALVGWAASFLLGFLYFKPEGERIGALVERHGPMHEEVDRRLRRLNVVDRLQLTILFLVLADMVIKPNGEDTAVLVVGAVILGAAGALAARSIRRGATPQPAAP